MSVPFNPFESYFDPAGRPTMQGQQLLARLGALLPPGGLPGYVLAKVTATDYDTEWAELSGSGSGSFLFDDGDASGGGEFVLEEGGA